MGKWRYGVILDAGSSGTRVHIYRWKDNAKAKAEATEKGHDKQLASLPELETKKKWTKKIRPGVSTFGPRPAAVGNEHLKQLLDHALSIVPPSQVVDTPIFLMATAGVRLLPSLQQAALLREICAYTQTNTDFLLPDCDLHIQVIPGETEGLYGWVAANYLLGGFDAPERHAHGKGHHTYGFLDMGGASAQIAFAPNATEAERHADDLKLLRMRRLDGQSVEYKVFVATWLGFGVNEARHRYLLALQDSSASEHVKELPDPCLPRGLYVALDGTAIDSAVAKAGTEPYLLGQGIFKECLSKTFPLLDKDMPCEDRPCLLHGQHTPAIDFDVNHFVGVSEYWHTTHEIFEMSHKDKAYDFKTYQTRVMEFCNQDWSAIDKGILANKWGSKVDAKTAMEVCFKASWLINMLHDGIGIPRIGLEKLPTGSNGTKELLDHAKEKGFLDPFQAVDKIDDTEVSWTLGKMVLYAAGQIEPTGDVLPVGFGANVASGIPKDFQYAGSSYSSISPIWGDDDNDDWSDTVDDILDRAPRKSVSGMLLVALLILFLIYVFRKQDRRTRVYNKFNHAFRHSRRPGSPRSKSSRGLFGNSKLFGRSTANYQRVMEDGTAAHEFELYDADSDDNDHSDGSDTNRVGRSGFTTPKLTVISPEGHQFDAMDRSGIIVRNESRDRLMSGIGLLSAGRKSRNGSPTRKASPMAPVIED